MKEKEKKTTKLGITGSEWYKQGKLYDYWLD